MSLFRHALINSEKKHFLKTICYELLSTPAYLGRTKGKHISLSGEVAENATILTIREKINPNRSLENDKKHFSNDLH